MGNPNLKRDKTNNNNFTSTFSSTSTAQFQPLQPSLVESSPSSSLVTSSGSTTNTLDYQKLGLNNPSITDGCVDQQQQRLGGPTGSVQGPGGNGSLQRPNGGGHNLQLHAINSTVGTHV